MISFKRVLFTDGNLLRGIEVLFEQPLVHKECQKVRVLAKRLQLISKQVMDQKIRVAKSIKCDVVDNKVVFDKNKGKRKEQEEEFNKLYGSYLGENVNITDLEKIIIPIKKGRLPDGRLPVAIFYEIMDPFIIVIEEGS